MASHAASAALRKPPRLGNKQIFLPNFTLTLLRTPLLPPTFASFIVPLNINKLDLRDYLWNCYGIRALNVRSYIQQQKIRQDKPGASRPHQRRWFRPRAIKKMTVEMETPFVWPEEPENFDAWDKTTFDAANEERDNFQADMRPDAKEKRPKDRLSIAEQAQALLAGKAKWDPRQTMWQDEGEAREVETDIVIPKEDRPDGR